MKLFRDHNWEQKVHFHIFCSYGIKEHGRKKKRQKENWNKIQFQFTSKGGGNILRWIKDIETFINNS